MEDIWGPGNGVNLNTPIGVCLLGKVICPGGSGRLRGKDQSSRRQQLEVRKTLQIRSFSNLRRYEGIRS